MKAEEFEVERAQDEARNLMESCQQALDKIIPCLNEATSTMNAISKYDLAEMKSMSHPPDMVKKVLKATCVLLQVEPQEAKTEKGTYELDYWTAAIGPNVLGDPMLPERLSEFDKTAVDEERMAHIEEILSDPDYSKEKAIDACKALMGLFNWVQAIRDYFYLYTELAPRRDALILSEKQYKVKQEQLKKLQLKIKSLENILESLKEHQDEKTLLVVDLKVRIQETTLRKRRGDKIMISLFAEKQKWLVCSRMLDNKYSTVNGDVVLGAAMMCFAGGFVARYRRVLIAAW